MAKANNTRDFYVYLHRKKSNGQVFYIGKGSMFRAFSKSTRNPHWKNIVRKHGYTVELYATGLQEWYAFELEKDLILYYGKENLCNKADGGDGQSGWNLSEETKRKMAEAKVGKKRDERTKNKISKKLKNRVFSDETIKRMSEAKKGKVFSDEHKRKIRESRINIHLTEETKLKMSLSIKKAWEKKKKEGQIKNAKKIICIETGFCFYSINSAAKYVSEIIGKKASAGNLSSACSGKYNMAYGFTWRYA